uniref:Myosin heavy chain, non-muscle-like n=1 Tax=Phallusia mammillata TaxID=59560 RepID=A0A6F9DMB9_9ASCI|nr:myosin heavy chain, non-muscle-like [Phallusia mammillata]
MTTIDYDEKIKRLFEEGAKLGATNPKQNDITNLPARNPSAFDAPYESPRDEPYSSEKYKPTPSITFQPIQPSRNLNSNSNNNVTDPSSYKHMSELPRVLNLGPGPSEMADLTNTKIHLENALQDSQIQVDYLTQKLEETKELMGKQKEQFRSAIEQLQKKLQDTVAGRKQLLDLRHHEMHEQEEMIQKLQSTLKELAASNQLQEQALLDAHERMEIMQNKTQASDQALANVRTILSSALQKESRNHSQSFSNVEKVSEFVPDVLVRSLENYITSSQAETDSLRNRVLQLESELNATNQTHEAERMVANSDAADTIKNLKAEYQKSLSEARANTQRAMDEANTLSDQVKDLQQKNTSQEKLLSDAQDRILAMNTQIEEMRSGFSANKDDLRSKLINAECDLRLAKEANAYLTVETDGQKQSINDLQTKLNRVEEELRSEREQRRNLWLKETDSNKEINEMRNQIEEKNLEISRLREIAAQLRGDLNTRLAREVSEAENAQRIKDEERISEITRDNAKLREELARAKSSVEAMERQISDKCVQRTGAMQMIQDKDQQVERLTTQLSLSDRKLIEATEARKTADEKVRSLTRENNELSTQLRNTKADLDRAHLVADDRERVARQLRQQLETKNQEATKIGKEAVKSEDERRDNAMQLKEKTKELENLSKKLKEKDEMLEDYETRISDLVQEKGKIADDIRGIEKEVQRIVKGRDEMYEELTEARFQVGHLIEERDALSKRLKLLHGQYDNEVEKLKRELRHKKRDLQEAQDTLYTIKNVDGKAAKIAAVMQKELTDKRAVIDSLQSEVTKVYDKVESLERDNKKLKKEIANDEKKIEILSANLHDVNAELRKKTKNEKGYKLASDRLQKALEKAAERNAEAQVVIDKQEEELSQGRIKRGLQMLDRKKPGPAMQPTIDQQLGVRLASAPTNENATLQNALIRVLSSMTTREQAQQPMPSRDHFAEGDGPPSNRENVTTNDIFKLLSEVRDQIASREVSTSLPAAREKRHKGERRKHRRRKAMSSADESSDLPVVLMQSDVTSTHSDPLGVSTTMYSDDNLREKSPKGHPVTSSPKKHGSRRFGGHEGGRAPSPVSILLAAGDASLIPTKENEPRHYVPDNDDVMDRDVDDIITRERARDKFVKAAISDNAEELCRQLQDRLQGLSEMGGKLEKQNKAAASLMKKQDKKLKKVRASEPKWR